MSDKLKAIESDHFDVETFQAIYPGDTAYRAVTYASGALRIMELPSRDSATLVGQKAAELIDSLRDAEDAQGYDDWMTNAVQHWLLARAFGQARPQREATAALGSDEWPVSTPSVEMYVANAA